MQIQSLDGNTLKRMIQAGAIALGQNRDAVNALNVFPVPDGDTGTNMYLTLLAAAKEVEKVQENSVTKVADAAAQGSLMGARGNSGVISSQFFRGFAQAVQGKDKIDPRLLGRGFQEAVQKAYRAVMKPTEGTILTVAREGAKAAADAAKKGAGIVEVMRAAIAEGEKTLAKTPQMLAVLREAGVVDAGGKGLLFAMNGALEALKDEKIDWGQAYPEVGEDKEGADVVGAQRLSAETTAESLHFRYCTEFLIKGSGLDPEIIKETIGPRGDSMLVVGGPDLVKVHIHTNNPGKVLDYCGDQGDLLEIKISNMAEQNKDLIEAREAEQKAEFEKAMPKEVQPPPQPAKPTKEVGVVSVVVGEGLQEVFRSLGVDGIVSGGQTMNPSTQDLLSAVESLPHSHVIILPNNGNVILTAKQVSELTKKKIEVVPTKSVPQGISAMLAYDSAKGLAENTKAMSGALTGVKTGEVTYAVRSTRVNGVDIQEMDVIGIFDGEIKTVGKTPEEVAVSLLKEMADEATEVITVYAGSDTQPEQIEKLKALTKENFSNYEVEFHPGGQPLYYYLFSVE